MIPQVVLMHKFLSFVIGLVAVVLVAFVAMLVDSARQRRDAPKRRGFIRRLARRKRH